MPLDDKELDDFIEQQFKLFDDTTTQIRDNVSEYHRTHCENSSLECEASFHSVFMMVFGMRLKEERNKSKINPDLN